MTAVQEQIRKVNDMEWNTELENEILLSIRAIEDNDEGRLYLVDYTNFADEDIDGRASMVCVHYEDTYMVDNTVSSHNTRKIYLDEVIANPNRYIAFELTPLKLTNN